MDQAAYARRSRPLDARSKRLLRRLLASTAAAATILGAAAASAEPPTAPPPHSAWPQNPTAPANAPNVLVILTDDVGFGATGTFGGPIPTPNLDALAHQGLMYNRFHTTAICSSTRAALLTGRNHHRVGMGDATNLPSDFDGYTTVLPKTAATIAEILKENGYDTAMFGKSHLTPEWEMGPTGPFDHWPTGLGFEYFYGFLEADTNQFAPSLVENQHRIPTPGGPGYILDRDLADHAIQWIREQHGVAPNKPFFVYFATGSAHAPNQAPAEWIAKFKGRFDRGWDEMREETFERQKALGVIPPDAKLTPRPPEFPAWDSLSADQKRVYARFMEAYAGQLAFNDDQLGRLIQSLRDSGQFDHTLIILMEGDNGASGEGGLGGRLFEPSLASRPDSLSYQLSRLNDIGGPTTYNLYPIEWAWAMDTPFQWTKQIASHFGGTRNGMVVSWPDRIRDHGAVRSQFTDVTDVTPTILEATGIAAPQSVDGVPQMSMDGLSFAYTFDHQNTPSHRGTQYFEMVQNAAIYHDGWIAATHPVFMPWMVGSQTTVPLSARQWELYHIDDDFSEANNLASQYPDKLKQMQQLFLSEAERNHVLPLHAPRDGVQGRPSVAGGRTSFTFYPGTTNVYRDSAPQLANRSFEIVADVDVPASGGSGVMVAQGGRFDGYSLYLNHGKPTFAYNAVPPDISYVRSDRAVSPGHHLIAVDFHSDGGPVGSGGSATIKVDDAIVAQGRIEHTMAEFWHNEGLDVGQDAITPVSGDYDSPNTFNGEIHKVTIQIK